MTTSRLAQPTHLSVPTMSRPSSIWPLGWAYPLPPTNLKDPPHACCFWVSYRARKIFEFHLACWANNPQILLARGTHALAQVFKLINNSRTKEWKSNYRCNIPILAVLLVLITFTLTYFLVPLLHSGYLRYYTVESICSIRRRSRLTPWLLTCILSSSTKSLWREAREIYNTHN